MNPFTLTARSTLVNLKKRRWLAHNFFAILLIALAHLDFVMASPQVITVLCLGDSLTEGYGVEKDKAYPALVEEKYRSLRTKDSSAPDVHVINAGISGSTTASALSRLKWYLNKKPQVLFLALGANDGLRGQDINAAKANLRATIELAKQNNITVWLAGMHMPPNYGATYTKTFHQLFIDLAKEEKISLMPFLLEGVALHPDLIQPDGLHPNEKGHVVLASHVFDFFQTHIKEVRKSP